MAATEKKQAVYLCEGCGISDAISLDELEQAVTGEMRVPLCRRIDACCGEDGLAQIKKDIDKGEVTQAIIAACSPRVMCEEFDALGAQVIRANLREQVIWSQPAGDENTQMLATDHVRMAVAKAAKTEKPAAHGPGASSMKLLVVGGGVTGLSAAREASKTGADVVLVEKTGELGGWAGKWSKHIPYASPYRGLQENPLPDLIKEVMGDKAITVKTNTTVARTEGGPGEFAVQLQNGKGDEWDVFGAIVVATGWRPYDTAKLEPLGYGSSPHIVTDIEFEDILSAGLSKKTKKKKSLDVVAFVIPGGADRMPYSSGVSDRVAIKQALQVVEAVPGAMVYVIYEDLRAHGTAEEFYREAQEAGVVFQKGEVISISSDLTVTVRDDLLGEEVPMSGIDMVVISTGMVPNSTDIDREPSQSGADQLKDDIDPRVPITFSGKLVNGGNGAEPDEAAGDDEPALPGGPILNLQYRQGPHIPILANGFADSHYICFPYETRRTGIYTCGPVRRAMTVGEARQDAQGAVLKAIQAMRAADESLAVHPRSGDLSYPKINHDICTKCRRCTVECPFGAIDEDPDGRPHINFSRCRRCGTCMGACPVRTITFDNYNPQMVADMIGAVEVPDEFSEKPRILVLACENDAYPALDMAGINRRQLSPYLRIIPVRCLGSVTMLWISTALEKGFDGVMLMGCKSGDDYQCHFIKGSGIAEERMSSVGETLKSMMLEEDRVVMEEVSIADSVRAPRVLNEFADKIGAMPPNPFKGF